jgi:branched-chain amino acid aminotransferase
VVKIAESAGLHVIERNIHKEELYTCDEAFFAGTAAELTPITKIDGRKIGNGRPGQMTKMLAEKYTEIVSGKNEEFENWLTYA